MTVWSRRSLRVNNIEQSIMARTPSKKPTKTPSRPAVAKAPERRPGRPAGSKNRVAAAPEKAASVSARATASRKSAPAAPKMNKADLEAHVTKLERTISRLREQNKELKRAAVERPEPVEAPEPKAKPARRSSKPAAEAPVAEAQPVETSAPLARRARKSPAARKSSVQNDQPAPVPEADESHQDGEGDDDKE